MASVNLQNYNNYNSGFVVKHSANVSKPLDCDNENKAKELSFKQNDSDNAVHHNYEERAKIRTTLATKTEKIRYNELSKELDGKYRRKLEYALKSGILLKDNSDDGSTVLDNLHKIISTDRDPGLDSTTILKECLDIISNPYVITQNCEDIPEKFKLSVIGLVTNVSEDKQEINKLNYELDNMHTGTCPTASIEFDLATKNPAEFFRIVEGLTSKENAVTKTIDTSSLSDKKLDVAWLLDKFNTPHEMKDFDKVTVLLKPDENAIIRARIQNNNRDKGERSIIDVLMQSTMMQLGSQQTYDSLTDKRKPNSWTDDDTGLIEFEKTFVESVMENKPTISVIYQKVDENGRFAGYEKDLGIIKQQLLETLDEGYNINIGYTWADPDNENRLAGHEITIVGTKQDKNGKTVFICQDSDDGKDKPIEMKEDELLKSIHHAGLPEHIALKYEKYEDSWKYGVDEFQNQLRA